MTIASIGSSSSGNSYLIRSGSTNLLLDVGLSARAIREGLASFGVDEANISGICVTHEHIDHVRSIRAISRACDNAEVIATMGTAENCENFEHVPDDRLRMIRAQDNIHIGDIGIKAFALSHDAAEPVGYSFTSGDTKLTVVTDTGIVTGEIYNEIIDSDMLVLEANHEIEMLEVGPYPYFLKQRILSDHGHLSNIAAGEALASVIESRRSAGMPSGLRVMLAHLSTTNNTPDNAGMTVTDVVRDRGFEPGTDYSVTIAAKKNITGIE